MIYYLALVTFAFGIGIGFVLGVAVDFKIKSEELDKPRPKPKDWHKKEHKTWKVDYDKDTDLLEWHGQRN